MSEPGRETGDPEIVLGLLTSIERDSAITQRKLAGDLGIALGLANSYLRRCVRKGLVKMSQVPLNRYAYYLTPQGFAEKSRLTAEYLSVSFDFFRRARGDCALLLRQCAARGWRRVALYGAGDLAEIAVLSAGETGIEVVCVIDPGQAGRALRRVAGGRRSGGGAACSRSGGLDGIILTDTRAPQARFEQLLASGGAARRAGLLHSGAEPACGVAQSGRDRRRPTCDGRRRNDLVVCRLYPAQCRTEGAGESARQGYRPTCRATAAMSAMRAGAHRAAAAVPALSLRRPRPARQRWRPICSTVGVAAWCSSGDEPVPVAAEIVEALRGEEERGRVRPGLAGAAPQPGEMSG